MQLEKFEEVVKHREYAVSLLSEKIATVYSEISDEIKAMDEISLTDQFQPTPNDFWVRKKLWELVDLGQSIDTVLLIGGNISRQYFYANVLKQPHRLMWIMTPWKSHQENFEEAFLMLHHKLMKYITTSDVTSRNVGQLTSLYDNLANRAVGPVAKHLRVQAHLHSTSDQTQKSPADLERELKLLKEAKPVLGANVTAE